MQKKECLVLLCKNERPCWTCEILVWACKPQQLTLVTVNFPKRGTYLFMYIILKRCIGILKEYLGKMRCIVNTDIICFETRFANSAYHAKNPPVCQQKAESNVCGKVC